MVERSFMKQVVVGSDLVAGYNICLEGNFLGAFLKLVSRTEYSFSFIESPLTY